MSTDPSLLAPLLANHREFVRRLALALVSQDEDAEDVAQEAWLAALQNPPGQTHPLAVRGWFRRVVANAARQRHRGASRRSQREEANARGEQQPDSTKTVERLEFHEVLVQRVLALDEPLRTTVVLRFLEDESAANVACRMAVPTNTVHVRLRRALALLRHDLDQSAGGNRSAWALALLPSSMLPKSLTGAGPSASVLTLIGSIVATKIALAVAIVVIATLWWLQQPGGPTSDMKTSEVVRLGSAKMQSPSTRSPSTGSSDGSKLEGQGRPKRGGRSRAAVPATAALGPRCLAFGRVIDGDNKPLSGVSVVFYAWPEWSDLDLRNESELVLDGEYFGFELRTNEAGEFHLDAPVPTASEVNLSLEFGSFYSQQSVIYGGTYHSALQTLGPGEQDLGTFVLKSAGVVSGRVVDEFDAPVEGAEVSVNHGFATTLGLDVETDASGRYRVEHVPAGNYGVSVNAEGYISRHEESLVVQANQNQRGPTFSLKVGPTLEGTVQDEQGSPIFGAYIWCIATEFEFGGARNPGAESDEQGRFTVYLHHDVPHTLEVEAEGFISKPWIWEERFDPNSKDIEIVLAPASRVALLVMDAQSKRPIEQFDINLIRKDWTGWAEWVPRYQLHEGGRVRIDASSNGDVIEVAAAGYRRAELLASDGLCEVLLEPGPRLIGRLLSDGQPVPHPRVTVEMGEQQESGWRSEPGWRTRTIGEADGNFSVELSSGGEYRVEIFGASSSPLLLVPVEIPEEGVLDLGNLDLPESGIIEGRIELPPGVPVDGIEIHISEVSSDPVAHTDAHGEFRIELPPGAVTIAAEKDGLLEYASDNRSQIDVVAGINDDIVLRLDPERVLCAVSIVLSAEGKPISGLSVGLQPENENYGRGWLGDTDNEGLASGLVPTMGPARILVTGLHEICIQLESPLVVPLFPKTESVDVELVAGQLRLDWASEPHIPSGSENWDRLFNTIGVELFRAGDEPETHWINVDQLKSSERDGIRIDSLEFGPLLPGSYFVRMMLAKAEDGNTPPNLFGWPPPFTPQLRGSAIVDANQLAVCRLEK